MGFEDLYLEYQFDKEKDNLYRNMDYKEMIELITKISHELPSAEFDNSTFFDFYVNATMQGHPHPCSEFSCRKNNLERTLRFASLYAERLVLVNPFEALAEEIINDDKCKNIDYHRYCLMNEIKIMNFLKPFIKKGIIKYGKSEIHLCKDCLEEKILNKNNQDRFISNMLSKMEEEYLKKIKVTFNETLGFPRLSIACPEEINPHGEYSIHFDEKWFNNNRDKYKLNNTRILDDETIKQLDLLELINYEVFNNIVFGNFYSLNYGTQNLTDNQFEFEINNHYKCRNTNNIIDIFEHSMPFILDVDVSDILELRYAENDSFENYRETVKMAVNEVKDLEDFAQQTDAFSDIVRPGIMQIENKIKNIRKSLFNKLKRDIVIAGGSIYLASNNTIFDPNISNYITAAGGLTVFGDILDKTKNILFPEKLVSNEPLYFLWKLKKEAPKI